MRKSGTRRWLIVVSVAPAAIIALLLTFAPIANRATAQDGATVEIADFSFGPNSVTIEAGTSVTWVNNDLVTHTATGVGGAFDTGEIAAGASVSVTFDTPGAYAYTCTIHPDMTGTIVVVAADDGIDVVDDVTELPDTGVGAGIDGQIGGTGATIPAALAGLFLTVIGVAFKRRIA